MQKNIELKESNYKELENLISRIAFENDIKDVEEISISLDKDTGIIKFRTAAHFPSQTSDPTVNGTPSMPGIMQPQDQILLAVSEGDEEKRKKEKEEEEEKKV